MGVFGDLVHLEKRPFCPLKNLEKRIYKETPPESDRSVVPDSVPPGMTVKTLTGQAGLFYLQPAIASWVK